MTAHSETKELEIRSNNETISNNFTTNGKLFKDMKKKIKNQSLELAEIQMKLEKHGIIVETNRRIKSLNFILLETKLLVFCIIVIIEIFGFYTQIYSRLH